MKFTMVRRRNSDSCLRTPKHKAFGYGFSLAHTSSLSQRLHDFIFEAVNAQTWDSDCIAHNEDILYKTFPHLSHVINSFCEEVDGFVKRLKAQANPEDAEIIMISTNDIGERVTQELSTGCQVPDNNILDTTSFAYKDVPDVNDVLESQFEELMYASSENDGSGHSSGGSALGLDEENSSGDDEAPTFVESVQDNGSWDSSSHRTLHETTQISATGIVALDKLDESATWSQTQSQSGSIFPMLEDDDQCMRTGDEKSDKNHPDPIVSADIPFRPEEGNQGGEEYSSEVEHSEGVEEEAQPQEKEKEGGVEEEDEEEEDDDDDDEEDEDELDKHNDNSHIQALKKQAQQGASKKRHAPSRKPPKKRMKTNPETQVRALDSTRMLELSLADLPELPRGTIEPHAVYLMLQNRCQHQPEEDLRLLTKLFFLIGSPPAVAQLQDAVLTIRRQMVSRTQNSTSMAHISHWLDQVELSAPLARRYGIISLSQRRRELEKWHKDQNGLRQSSRRRKSMKSNMTPRGGGTEGGSSTASKTDAAALHDLVVECYPHLRIPVRGSPDPQDDEFVRKKSQLQYRLSAARNYVLLQEMISTGAVALIPIEGISATK